MPRANRYHVPGCIWHITHRCHKREFLLKFVRDRRRWVHWLFEARKRYGLTVLNFVVTSDHIHLLAVDGEKDGVIARSMQLVAGRVGQEYNLRKQRKGAFWEDRYHATAIESGEHLRRCMVYIDLNMCRAGAVSHPAEWECCGFRAIQHPPRRYHLIDRQRAAELLGYRSAEELTAGQSAWVESSSDLHDGRDVQWSESLAVGSQAFVEAVWKRLGVRAQHREMGQDGGLFILKEQRSAYRPHSTQKSEALSADNTFPWMLSD